MLEILHSFILKKFLFTILNFKLKPGFVCQVKVKCRKDYKVEILQKVLYSGLDPRCNQWCISEIN